MWHWFRFYLWVRVFRTLFIASYCFIKAVFLVFAWIGGFPSLPKNKKSIHLKQLGQATFQLGSVFFFSESGQPEKPPPQKKTTRRFLTTHLGLASCRYSICIWLFAWVLYIIYILHTNTNNIDIYIYKYSDQNTVVYKKGSSEHGHLSFEYIYIYVYLSIYIYMPNSEWPDFDFRGFGNYCSLIGFTT